MSKQHYISATLIGNFSMQEEGLSRKRPIWVKRRNSVKPYNTIPEQVAYRNDMYTFRQLPYEDPNFVDNMWFKVESKLPSAIDALVNTKNNKNLLEVLHWTIIVRFIGQLFVRGFEFEKRFEKRLSLLLGVNKLPIDMKDNTNLARLMELQRLLAPIMYSEMAIFQNNSSIPIIQNDIGYTLFWHKDTGKVGYAIPLNKQNVLLINRGKCTKISQLPIINRDNVWWYVGIKHKNIYKEDVLALNNSIAANCINEIYGATDEVVNLEILKKEKENKIGLGPDLIIPSGGSKYLRKHEYDYFKLLSGISTK